MKIHWRKWAIVAALVLGSYSAYGTYKYISSGGSETKKTAIVIDPKQYDDLVKFVEQGLSQHPEHTNRLICRSIDAMVETNTKYEPETYARMFEVIREKAEEKPEIMDYFNSKAKYRIIETRADQYKQGLIETAKDAVNSIKPEQKLEEKMLEVK